MECASANDDPTRFHPQGLTLDYGLTTEQQMVVDTVRGFVKQGTVSARGGGRAHRAGGGGLDNLTFALLERGLGRTSMALGVFWIRPSGILMGCEGE